MKRTLLVILITTGFSGIIKCQEHEDVILLNSKPITTDRYPDIKGSPYFFKDFVVGNIVSSRAETFHDMKLNYNAYTKEFEVRQGDKYIELDKSVYMRVEVLPEENPELNLQYPLVFQKGFNVNWVDKFGILIYSGKRIKFVKDIDVIVSEKVIQDVGKTVKFKSFYDKGDYYFIIDGDLTNIRLKEKKILSTLGNSSELQKYVKENNLDLKSEVGVRKLLAFWEENQP